MKFPEVCGYRKYHGHYRPYSGRLRTGQDNQHEQEYEYQLHPGDPVCHIMGEKVHRLITLGFPPAVKHRHSVAKFRIRQKIQYEHIAQFHDTEYDYRD